MNIKKILIPIEDTIREKVFKTHKHRFVMVDWDREKYGHDFKALDEGNWYGEYKFLYKCKCGEEKVKTVTGRI